MDQRETLARLSGHKGWLTAVRSNHQQDRPQRRGSPGPREAGLPGFESLPGAGSFDLTLPLDHSAPLPTMKREKDPQTDCSL